MNANPIPGLLPKVESKTAPVASSKERASPVKEGTVPRKVEEEKVGAEAARKVVVEKIVLMKTKAVRKVELENTPLPEVVPRRVEADSVAGLPIGPEPSGRFAEFFLL